MEKTHQKEPEVMSELLITNLPSKFKTQKLKTKVKQFFKETEIFKITVLKVKNEGEEEIDQAFAILKVAKKHAFGLRDWSCSFSKRTLKFIILNVEAKNEVYLERIIYFFGKIDRRILLNFSLRFGNIQYLISLEKESFVNRKKTRNRTDGKFFVIFNEKVDINIIRNYTQKEWNLGIREVVYKDPKLNENDFGAENPQNEAIKETYLFKFDDDLPDISSLNSALINKRKISSNHFEEDNLVLRRDLNNFFRR